MKMIKKFKIIIIMILKRERKILLKVKIIKIKKKLIIFTW